MKYLIELRPKECFIIEGTPKEIGKIKEEIEKKTDFLVHTFSIVESD